MSTEKLQQDTGKEEINIAKVALSLLEKETRVNFFRKASNGLKNIFGLKGSSKKENNRESARIDASKNTKEASGNYTNEHISEAKVKESRVNYTNEHISDAKVKKARDYIENGGTFYSPSKGTITWGKGKYKHVCSTGSYAVLDLLGIKNKSGSNECDLEGKILPKMGLKYIGEVNPNNPGKNGYKPQDGDTAVWPRFKNGKKMTQHQATFINGHWVSDTIQNKMSCYSSKNEPMVKVYRYTGKKVA